jgi:membrane protein implicated in regulation of membrane protease activity
MNPRRRRFVAVGVVLLLLAGVGNSVGVAVDIPWLVIAGGALFTATAVVLAVLASQHLRARDRARGAEQAGGASLIQQRMRLDRERTAAIWTTVAPIAYVPIAVIGLVDHPADVLRWTMIVFGATILVYGIVTLRRARRRTRDFEQEHGRDAGRQRVVS